MADNLAAVALLN